MKIEAFWYSFVPFDVGPDANETDALWIQVELAFLLRPCLQKVSAMTGLEPAHYATGLEPAIVKPEV